MVAARLLNIIAKLKKKNLTSDVYFKIKIIPLKKGVER